MKSAKGFRRCFARAETIKRILKVARPSDLWWVEQTNRLCPVAVCSPLDRASSLFWWSNSSDAPRMLFLSLQVLGAVSTHSLFNIKHILSEQLSFSTINRELSYSSKKNYQTQPLSQTHSLLFLSLTQL